jgi:hypothetical protein
MESDERSISHAGEFEKRSSTRPFGACFRSSSRRAGRMVVIAQDLLSRRYEAPALSFAGVFHFACYVALIILPFVTAYSSQCNARARVGRRCASAAWLATDRAHSSHRARAWQHSGLKRRQVASSPRSTSRTRSS